MIKDMLVSFTENLKTKSTNPFFGTLILVWITKNWNLIYSLFNFDKDVTLVQKREFIINHFSKQPLIEELLWCVLETFIIILISYFLVNLSRLIINFYEKRLTPLVYKQTDEKSIVLKSVYDISEKERKRLEKKLDEERDAKLKLQEDYDKLEKRMSEIVLQYNQAKSNENKEKGTMKSKSIHEEKINLLINKLEKDNKTADFEKIASLILTNKAINKENQLVEELTTNGIITQGTYYSPDYYYFKLTEIGKEMHDRLLVKKLK